MTALVVFDIEAVPDLKVGRRLLGQDDNTPDSEIRLMLGERYARNGEDPKTAFLKAPLYQIVCIAALYAKRDEGGGPWTATQIGVRSVDEKTESELLLGFVKSLPVDGRGTGPMLVTFGGNGFDLPLLRYRAFALGVSVPGLHNGGHRNYWHRFGQDHVDLCDMLSTYGASVKPSLAEIAALANIPVKIGGIDGGQVEAYVAGGRLPEVADYCLTDVLATYCVFLRHEMVRGV
jgi:predicted PolB exonuclease-like 3'-5' exonuclease